MMPSDEVVTALLADPLLLANVYGAPVEQIAAPAVVLRPDEPWISKGRPEIERYMAIAVVTAASPSQGIAELHRIIHRILADVTALEGWGWSEAGTAIVDESTGAAFLAARVRLEYRDCIGA
jgi:hypothetical protein